MIKAGVDLGVGVKGGSAVDGVEYRGSEILKELLDAVAIDQGLGDARLKPTPLNSGYRDSVLEDVVTVLDNAEQLPATLGGRGRNSENIDFGPPADAAEDMDRLLVRGWIENMRLQPMPERQWCVGVRTGGGTHGALFMVVFRMVFFMMLSPMVSVWR